MERLRFCFEILLAITASHHNDFVYILSRKYVHNNLLYELQMTWNIHDLSVEQSSLYLFSSIHSFKNLFYFIFFDSDLINYL